MNTHSPNPEPTGLSAPKENDSTPTSPPREHADGNTTIAEPSSPPPSPRPPSVIGKYMIREAGLAGGMGIVYKAHDIDLDRIVALKLIKGGVLATSEEMARFHREAQAAARLHHPNIIPVYEIGQEHGCPYFTMAFASGGSLAQHRDLFADSRAAAALLEKIARAIHYAHQHGILHRDLKPANILFDEHRTPLVSDFGLAKFVDATLELTRPGQVLGTPAYMAPEQASGQLDQVSAQTDVWALGVLLFELLTGQRPFKGESQEEKLHQVRTADPPRPRSLNRALDRPLETVILKCLEKEPSQRYESAEALADDLALWLRGEPVLARPPSWLVRAGRALRRYRTLALRLVFAVILLVLLVLAWRGHSPSASPTEEGNRKALEKKLSLLDRGKKVTLLGESGPPVWWRWQPRRLEARTMEDMNHVFRIYAGKQPGMLELLPSAPKRYRLRAQVQHADSREQGIVGIYFAHGKHETEEGTTHCFFQVAFNDRIPSLQRRTEQDAPQSEVRLTLPIYRDKKDAGLFRKVTDLSCAIAQPFTPAETAGPMPWRTLEVEVTPEWIKTSWEGESIKTHWWEGQERDGVDPKKVLQLAASHQLLGKVLRHKDNASEALRSAGNVELSLGEGIGLYVEKGVAAFRSVVIEPLPQK